MLDARSGHHKVDLGDAIVDPFEQAEQGWGVLAGVAEAGLMCETVKTRQDMSRPPDMLRYSDRSCSMLQYVTCVTCGYPCDVINVSDG